MKKQLLSIASLAIVFSVNAQFVQYPEAATTKTGIAFAGNKLKTVGVGEWVSFTPAKSDATCKTGPTWGIGGFTKPANIGFGLGAIQTGYQDFGTGCVETWPSFSFNTATTLLDLSAVENQKITISILSSKAFQVYFQVFDANFEAKLSTDGILNILGDSAYHDYELDFSKVALDGKDLAKVRQFSFVYANKTPLTADVSINKMALGSGVALGVNKGISVVSASKIYPNPTTGLLNIDFDLVKAANVNLELKDLMGKQIKNIEIGHQNVGSNKSIIGLDDLPKGSYLVNLNIDGVISNSSLVVKY